MTIQGAQTARTIEIDQSICRKRSCVTAN